MCLLSARIRLTLISTTTVSIINFLDTRVLISVRGLQRTTIEYYVENIIYLRHSSLDITNANSFITPSCLEIGTVSNA